MEIGELYIFFVFLPMLLRVFFVVALAEEVGEVLRIEFRETLAVVDGLAYDEHRGEGEMVVVDDLSQVFELAAINLLIRPCKMIAGCNGGVFRILLKQFSLDIINDGGREEDAHRALALSQQVELFFLRHRSPTLPSCEDYRLTTLRNRKLTLQLSCCSEEGGDAWGDVIVHPILIEESHLFLNGTKDTRIARM